jgi:hypothetical protein
VRTDTSDEVFRAQILAKICPKFVICTKNAPIFLKTPKIKIMQKWGTKYKSMQFIGIKVEIKADKMTNMYIGGGN